MVLQQLLLIGKSRLDWLRKDCSIILMGKPWETLGTIWGVLLAKVVVKVKVKKWGLTWLRDWHLTGTCDEATAKDVLNFKLSNGEHLGFHRSKWMMSGMFFFIQRVM